MMQKSRARDLGRVFAILALLALASIVGAVLYAPETEPFTYEVVDAGPAPKSGDGAGTSATYEPVKYSTTIDSLQRFGNAPRVQVTTPPTPPEGENTGPTGRDIKFLGAVTSGDDLIALVRIDGTQRFWRIDRNYEGITVESIERDRIILDENGLRRMVTLATRTGPIVTVADGASSSASPSNGSDPQQGRPATQEERQTELQRRREELMRQREEALKRARERGPDIDD